MSFVYKGQCTLTCPYNNDRLLPRSRALHRIKGTGWEASQSMLNVNNGPLGASLLVHLMRYGYVVDSSVDVDLEKDKEKTKEPLAVTEEKYEQTT